METPDVADGVGALVGGPQFGVRRGRGPRVIGLGRERLDSVAGSKTRKLNISADTRKLGHNQSTDSDDSADTRLLGLNSDRIYWIACLDRGHENIYM